MKLAFLEEFGRAFVPKRIRSRLRAYLRTAGIYEVPYKFFGLMFYVSLLLTYWIYISKIYPWLNQQFGIFGFLVMTFVLWVAVQLFIVGATMLIIYEYLDLRIFGRTRKMEDVLPEFLRYVEENLKGGMPFDKALWTAIRPRFGILADEIRLVAKRSMSGLDVDEAIKEFTEKYDSPMLKRSFNLIIEGIRGGAKIADVIERIENNLIETRELKREMNATNTTYVIFLSFVVLFISPALFALSYNLLLIS